MISSLLRCRYLHIEALTEAKHVYSPCCRCRPHARRPARPMFCDRAAVSTDVRARPHRQLVDGHLTPDTCYAGCATLEYYFLFFFFSFFYLDPLLLVTFLLFLLLNPNTGLRLERRSPFPDRRTALAFQIRFSLPDPLSRQRRNSGSTIRILLIATTLFFLFE